MAGQGAWPAHPAAPPRGTLRSGPLPAPSRAPKLPICCRRSGVRPQAGRERRPAAACWPALLLPAPSQQHCPPWSVAAPEAVGASSTALSGHHRGSLGSASSEAAAQAGATSTQSRRQQQAPLRCAQEGPQASPKPQLRARPLQCAQGSSPSAGQTQASSCLHQPARDRAAARSHSPRWAPSAFERTRSQRQGHPRILRRTTHQLTIFWCTGHICAAPWRSWCR